MEEYTSLRENSTSILERDKTLRSLKRYKKNVSLRVTLKDKCGIYTVYHFIDSRNVRVGMSPGKRGQQKQGALK